MQGLAKLFAVIISGAPLVIIELLVRLGIIKGGEISRKVSHVMGSLSVILAAAIYGYKQIVFVGLVFFIIMLATRSFHFWTSIYDVKRVSYGEITFVVGVGVSAYIANNLHDFIFVVLCLSFVDTAAFLVGKNYGKINIIKTKKTLEGSLAAFLLGLLLTVLFFQNIGVWQTFSIGISASLLELIAFNGFDNITIPVGLIIIVNLIATS